MSDRIYDVNGWYEIPRNPISRAGIFDYTAKSVGAPGWQEDPNRVVRVWRPESEISSDDTMASARLVPWIDDHTMLGDPDLEPGLTAPDEMPIGGTTGERIEYDPNSKTLFANLKMFGRQLAQKIDAGKKDLSMGFRCVYEHVNGMFEGQPYEAIQRNIRFNHNASVDVGRMGPGVAVMDGIERFAFDESEVREIPMKPTVRAKLAALMGVSVSALDAAIADPAKFKIALDAEAKEGADDDAEGEGGGSGDVTIQEAAETIKEIAGPLGELQEALAEMAGAGAASDPEDPNAEGGLDDDMEPVTDELGNIVMENGKPKMRKKIAGPATDATPPAIAAMDAALSVLTARRKAIKGGDAKALAAMDKAIAKSKAHLAKLKAPKRRAGGDSAIVLDLTNRLTKAEKVIAAMDANEIFNKAMKEFKQRDEVAGKLSNFVGAFDSSEMSLAQVGEYGNDKLKLGAPKGQELGAVLGYLNSRTTPSTPLVGADAAITAPNNRVSDFLAGKVAAA